MGLELNISISAVTVFLQGLLSFFSPCILPIIPLYMGYLTGGTVSEKKDEELSYNQKQVLFNTTCFTLGISTAFFILGLGFSTLGTFLTKQQGNITIIGGTLIIIMGLIQLGIFRKLNLYREFRLPWKINTKKMSPLTAFLMGFTFSFAWTPCVGPALSTVLIMVSSSSSKSLGMILMGIYTIGFILPFLFLGIFTTKVLNFLKNHVNIVRYTVKIGAVLMILIGAAMLTGQMSRLMPNINSDSTYENTDEESINNNGNNTEESDNAIIPAVGFELLDQYGEKHTLEDYKDKVIFLNFWATWCPPCVQELPDIQAIYESYGYNQDEVVILGVAMPNDNNSSVREGSVVDVTNFLKENNYTYPTLMDINGILITSYGISSYPSTFMIDKDGNIFGYIPGMMELNTMYDVIEQTLNK